MITGSVLYPGCGNEPLPEWIDSSNETRLDIDEGSNPDIVAPIVNMGDIGQFDHIYTSHTLEHLFDHEVQVALKEFLRVLKDGGDAIIFVPDLEGVRADRETLYESAAGPICGLDLYYGLSSYVEELPFYAHHTGFVKETLEKALKDAGFRTVSVTRQAYHNLMAVGIK